MKLIQHTARKYFALGRREQYPLLNEIPMFFYPPYFWFIFALILKIQPQAMINKIVKKIPEIDLTLSFFYFYYYYYYCYYYISSSFCSVDCLQCSLIISQVYPFLCTLVFSVSSTTRNCPDLSISYIYGDSSNFKFIYTYIYISGGWWLFNQRMLSKKVPSIFWISYFNLRFFFANFIEYGHVLFFKFNIRFCKNIFCDHRPKRILLCVSERRSQRLNLGT